MFGIDIIGYLDNNGKLIEGSTNICKKNIVIKKTDREKKQQTFFKNFNTGKWNLTSKMPKPQTQEFYILNAMFGVEVIFEE